MQMKKGISLIVLVITIIVMIILAASVVITLSNTGIINKASQAVDVTNQSQVQDIAALIWADVYMDGLRDEELVDKVKEQLNEQNIKEDKWIIDVTNTGITITDINSITLGHLIKASDIGKTVDYKANGVEDWKILYVDEKNGYVFLITSTYQGMSPIAANESVANLSRMANTGRTYLEIYNIFRLNNTDYTLTDIYLNNKSVAGLITGYSNYANTEDYGTNVVGAIGGPTVEILLAAYEQVNPGKVKYIIDKTQENGEYGYFIDWSKKYGYQAAMSFEATKQNYYYFVATPAALTEETIYAAGMGFINAYSYKEQYVGINPVVCLKLSTPATVGTTTDFSLVK